MKSYMDCLGEISSDELFEGLLGYGMFAEKLPPVFSSVAFYNYCVSNAITFNKKATCGYVYFESMRNTCIPRPMGIPNPMKYAILCMELRDNWEDIKNVFRGNTASDSYKVSRLHIRKQKVGTTLLNWGYDFPEEEEFAQSAEEIDGDASAKALFSMNNSNNWKEDGTPLLDFSLGKKFMVKTDIAQCFPSIYTHAIAWALAGKNVAKVTRTPQIWYNRIDHACQNMRNGETHGIMIGPHASNLISELILTSVDRKLRDEGYDFIRTIDDYVCLTKTNEEAERFLTSLNVGLREYDLSINQKKTIIEELPQLSTDQWVQQLQDKQVIGRYNEIDFKSARAYLDLAVALIKTNGRNASSLFFAIKALGGKPISEPAKKLCIKTMSNLAIIYPYLVPIIERYVFDAFDASTEDIKMFSVALYNESRTKANYEGISFALYFATKYGFIVPVDCNYIIQSTNCICKLLLLRYSRKIGDTLTESALLADARSLIMDIDENWVFVYEALTEAELNGDWKVLKHAGVTFLK